MKPSQTNTTSAIPPKPLTKEDLNKCIDMLADNMIAYFKNGPWEPLAQHYGFSFKDGDVLFLPEGVYKQICEELKIDNLPYYIISTDLIESCVFVGGIFKYRKRR